MLRCVDNDGEMKLRRQRDLVFVRKSVEEEEDRDRESEDEPVLTQKDKQAPSLQTNNRMP